MKYYFNKVLKKPFEKVIELTTEALKSEGFGVLTQIDVQATLKMKLDVDFKKYLILGACNPPFAHQALQTEELVGLFLPCNVVIRENEDGVEVAIADPLAMMLSVDNPKLSAISEEVRYKMQKVLERLK